MPFEIPYDLISHIQTITRKEANLPSDPQNLAAAVPSLPSALSELDPSPYHLRCKHCKGRLLNGLDSFICVFCGSRPDPKHEPIKFTSTIGYRWFLSSLRLDGSEVVELRSGGEASGRNRGQNVQPGMEIPLSELLGLEINWSSTGSLEGVRLGDLNLGGVDPSLFKSGKSVNEEEPVVVKHEEDGWEADFQSGPVFGSTDFKGMVGSSSSVDLSMQLDLMFGSDMGKKEGAIASSLKSGASEDWFEGDLWSGGSRKDNVGFTDQVEQVGVEATKGSSSLKVDWIGDGHWPNNAANEVAIAKAVEDEEDSFGDWNDFTGSTNVNVMGKDDGKEGVNRMLSSGMQSSEVELFGGTSSSQDVDFVVFSQSDFISRGSDIHNSMTGLNVVHPETLASNRIKSSSESAEWSLQVVQDGDVSNGNTESKTNALEELMSQMNDLSFMLASDLSIPKNKDPFISSSKD